MIEIAPKFVIWDLDGTLIDSFGIFADILADVIKPHGLAMPTADVLHKNYHGTLHHTIGAVLAPAAVELVDELEKDFLIAQEAYYENPETHIYADSLRMAERLHAAGIKQVIATNRFHEGRGNASPLHIVAQTSLKPFIDFVLCGDETDFRKPDARVTDDIPLLQGVSRSEIMVFGDQYVDAELAHNLGTSAVLCNRHATEAIPHLDDLRSRSARIDVVTSFDDVQLAAA